MNIAIFTAAQENSLVKTPKPSALKKLARHLLRRWQQTRDDQWQLWSAYTALASAHNTPRYIWRRHGALIMYARHRRVMLEKDYR